MSNCIVFDMDGTLANLYGVEGWLEDLRSFNPRPYILAEPLFDMNLLGTICTRLKTCGYRIVITSWLSKGSNETYDKAVRLAKTDWLARYAFPYDEIHLIKYGTTKANCTRRHEGVQILIDDNEKVRSGWHLGDTIDPTSVDIISALADLITE